jgi:alpha-ribazole phosphatase
MQGNHVRLLLIRHPKPVIEPGICYGQLDLAADDQDLVRVVRLLGERRRPIACASSPLIRAHHLALGMQKTHAWPSATLHSDLMEMSFGEWENRSWKEIERAQVDAWAADMVGYAPPGGESVTALARRSADALKQIAHSVKNLASPDDYVAVFCHAGVLLSAPTLLRGEVLDNSADLKLKYSYGDSVEVSIAV